MIYALIVAALSIAGGWIPLRARPGHAGLQVYLSLAAGALLGAALFHLLPESSEHIHGAFGLPAVFGVILVFLLQRYIAPHSHEPHGTLPDAAHEHHHDHTHHGHGHAQGPAHIGDDHDHSGHDHAHKGHGHEVAHSHTVAPPVSEAIAPVTPAISGVMAIAALCVHSFFDGVAIGAVTDGGGAAASTLTAAVFFSVLIHKPLDGLSVSVLLLDAGVSRRALWLTQLGYAALVPIGAASFHLTRGAVAEPSVFIGYTLAFSAGTFLAIALTDLLPELHFHAHDRHKLTAALLAGLLVMWATSLIGHPSHDGHDHAPASAMESDVNSARGVIDDHHDHDH